jgi:hypothetical protein
MSAKRGRGQRLDIELNFRIGCRNLKLGASQDVRTEEIQEISRTSGPGIVRFIHEA